VCYVHLHAYKSKWYITYDIGDVLNNEYITYDIGDVLNNDIGDILIQGIQGMLCTPACIQYVARIHLHWCTHAVYDMYVMHACVYTVCCCMYTVCYCM
jgi:hypothetical protein